MPEAVYIRNARVAVHPEDRGVSPAAAEPFAIAIAGAKPGYFGMIDVPIVRGSELIDAKDLWRSVVIGSATARRLWSGSDPIGKRFEVAQGNGSSRTLVVVGVYDSQYETTQGTDERLYVLHGEGPVENLLIRTAGPATALLDSVRTTVRQMLPTTPIGRLVTVTRMREGRREEAQLIAAGATAVGLLVLSLASLGLYGVVALAVGQRRREIGIRMALGARAGQVVGLLFVGGVRMSVIGLAIGLPLSVIALYTRVAIMRVPQVSMPLVGFSIAIAVLAVASLATWIPARRAATINPVLALRAE